jgi:hypothetical protein
LAEDAPQHQPSGANGGGNAGSVRPPVALFDALVIDEAAQAVEPAALVPLQLLKSEGKVLTLMIICSFGFLNDFIFSRWLDVVLRSV